MIPARIALMGIGLLLAAAPAAAQPVSTSGIDRLGRPYVLTLTGRVAKQDLPVTDSMKNAGFDVGAYIRSVCGADAGISRCDVYAGKDAKGTRPAGYTIASTGAAFPTPYYEPDGPDNDVNYTCIPAAQIPPRVPPGADGADLNGPIQIRKEGDDIRFVYDKRYGCKLDVDEKEILIGSMVWAAPKK